MSRSNANRALASVTEQPGEVCWACRRTLDQDSICKYRYCPLKDNNLPEIWYVRDPIRAYDFRERATLNDGVANLIRIYKHMLRKVGKTTPHVLHEKVVRDCKAEIEKVVTRHWDIPYSEAMRNPEGHPIWGFMTNPIPWRRDPFDNRTDVSTNVVLLTNDDKDRIETHIGRDFLERF